MAGAAAEGAGARRGASVGAELALATVVVLAVVGALVAAGLARWERGQLVSAKVASTTMIAQLAADGLVAPIDFSDADAVEADLGRLRAVPAVTAATVVLDDDHGEGLVVGDTQISIAQPIRRADGRRLATLHLQVSLAAENAAHRRTLIQILLGTAAVIGLTAAVLILLARSRILRPIARLSTGARRVRAGERGVRVVAGGGIELQRLADVFNDMSAAILEREASLETATRSLQELFDHMRQAIVVIGKGGVVAAAPSRAAAELFDGDLEVGAPVVPLLYPGDAAARAEGQAFREWLDLAFALAPEQWGELEELAPREIFLARDGEIRSLVVEFRPIAQGERIVRIMLLATDETEKRRLQAEVRSKDEEHARSMAAMRRILAAGSHVFVSFLRGAKRRLDRAATLLDGHGNESPASDLDEAFGHVHTVKGEARAFDLERLGDLLATVEDRIATARRGNDPTIGHAIAEALAAARSELERTEARLVEASPIGAAILDQVLVRGDDVARLFAIAGAREDEIGRIAARLCARPFGEIAGPLAERAPAWASASGKRAHVEVEGRDVLVPPGLASILPGALAHLVRNAIAHGVEDPDVRRARGKDENGRVRVVANAGERGPEVVVEDDGAGIDLAALGVERPSQIDRIFAPGVTTAHTVSDLAGRGIGLSAVRREVEAAGARIVVESSPGRGARFRIVSAP